VAGTARGRKRSRRERRALLGVLALALVVRLVLFLVVAPNPENFHDNDSAEYLALARDLAEGYGGDQGSELFDSGLKRPPGYPVVAGGILALGFDEPVAIVLVQLLAGVALVALVFQFTLRLADLRCAILAGVALAVDPTTVIHGEYIFAEAFFTVVLFVASVAFVAGLQEASLKGLAVAGALFGLSALFRPASLYLPLVLVPMCLVVLPGDTRRRIGWSLAFVAAFAVPVGGWMARNQVVTGEPAVLSTIDGFNLVRYRAPGAIAEQTGVTMAQARELVEARLARRLDPQMNAAERSRVQADVALDLIAEHPLGALKSTAKGAVKVIAGPGQDSFRQLVAGRSLKLAEPWKTGMLAIQVILLAALLVGATLGAIALWRLHARHSAAFFLLMIAYFVLVSAGPDAYARFRVPFAPFLALLAGIGYVATLRGGLVQSPDGWAVPARARREIDGGSGA
jgi:4-amino-4-deoxy-L-arabinose transferase-like glycosyltransferase